MSETQWRVLEYTTKSRTDREHVIIQSDTENIARCTGFHAKENANHIVALHNAAIELSARINDQTKAASDLLENTDKIRAELAQLRADLAAARAQVAMLDDYAETIRLHEITIAEHARQLDAARNAIRYLRPWRAKDIAADYASLVGGECGYTQSLSDYANAADAWLAANPAPEAEPQP